MHEFKDIYKIEKKFSQVLESKHIWKDSLPYVCRFCGEIEKGKFKKDAHIIPEGLGNRFLVSNFECDNCNEKFGSYESDLCEFLGPIRTLSLVEGKSKKKKNRIPKFKNFKTKVRIEAKLGSENSNQDNYSDQLKKLFANKHSIHLGQPPKDEVIFDKESKTFKFSITKNPYTPLSVFKAFLKIGYSFLNQKELSNYRFTQKLLDSKDANIDLSFPNIKNFFSILEIQFPHSNFFPTPQGILFKKEETFKSEYAYIERIFLLCFKSHAFQIPLIFSKNDVPQLNNKKGYKFPMFDFSLEYPEEMQNEYGKLVNNVINLSSNELKKNDVFKLETSEVNWIHEVEE